MSSDAVTMSKMSGWLWPVETGGLGIGTILGLTAAALGDDTLEKQTKDYLVPYAFTAQPSSPDIDSRAGCRSCGGAL
jgi:hypothetical protein